MSGSVDEHLEVYRTCCCRVSEYIRRKKRAVRPEKILFVTAAFQCLSNIWTSRFYENARALAARRTFELLPGTRWVSAAVDLAAREGSFFSWVRAGHL